jgi:hypothetical protein
MRGRVAFQVSGYKFPEPAQESDLHAPAHRPALEPRQLLDSVPLSWQIRLSFQCTSNPLGPNLEVVVEGSVERSEPKASLALHIKKR